jgi:hypothetical protein
MKKVRRHNRQVIASALPELHLTKPTNTDISSPSNQSTATDSVLSARATKPLSEGEREQALLIIVIAFGALGACIRAGMFFVGYTGQGTALRRWIMYYILQPFAGAVLSLIFYCVIRGGLVAQSSIQAGSVNIFFISGLAGLVGVFTKNALDRMELWFASFAAPAPGGGGTAIQKTKSVNTEDKSTPDPLPKKPVIIGFDPTSISLRASPQQIIIKGGELRQRGRGTL